MSDALIPFDFAGQGARGAILRIEHGVEAMFGARAYPPDVRRLLGEVAVAAPLMATHLKFEGRINLQFQGGRRIPLLVAQVDHRLQVRAMAKCREDAGGSFEALLEGGHLAWMLEPRHGQPYQAMVEIGADLARSLENYFAQSEQLPTRLRLACDGRRMAGLMLQRVPEVQGEAAGAYWQHLGALAGTLGGGELLDLAPEIILRRLFHQEPLRGFEAREVRLACSCSRASISRLLLTLGREEVQGVVESEGEVAVTCEFCGHAYRYSPNEINGLFDGAEAREPAQASQPRH